eukprot:UN06838
MYWAAVIYGNSKLFMAITYYVFLLLCWMLGISINIFYSFTVIFMLYSCDVIYYVSFC